MKQVGKSGDLHVTTFAVADVTTKDGENVTLVAAAGRKDDKIPTKLREDGDVFVRDQKMQNGDFNNRLNDAEQKIMRRVDQEGGTINAMGATREVCTVCQDRAIEAGVLEKIVTPLEERGNLSFSDVGRCTGTRLCQ
jgi:hypothetical protein